MTREVSAELAVTVKAVAAVEVTRAGTAEERLRRVEREIDGLNGRLTEALASISVEIDNAIATEFGQFESLSNVIKANDICWAVAGLAVGAVGILIRIFA
jgi:hypothetical protein